jgi:dihydroorotate dehydrogenase
MDRHLKTERELNRARGLLSLLEDSPWLTTSIERLTNRVSDRKLEIELDGIKFENPVIVGPGWDKIGVLVKIMFYFGFAGIEVGTVTKNPQVGNVKPRYFVMSPGVILNRFGFNSPGMEVVAKNLAKYKNESIPIGISLGKNKEVSDEDAPQAYASLVKKFYPYGSYFAINVSSPNTPGLRNLQNRKSLVNIIKAIKATIKSKRGMKPIYIKIAPDLEPSDLSQIVEVVLEEKLRGIIASNTTINTDIKKSYGRKWANEAGGVAGDDIVFRSMVTKQVALIRKLAGKKLTIIAAGGVRDANTALEKILAGANAVQVVSAIMAEGPLVANRINQGLLEWMYEHGVRNIKEIVGAENKQSLQSGKPDFKKYL